MFVLMGTFLGDVASRNRNTAKGRMVFLGYDDKFVPSRLIGMSNHKAYSKRDHSS